MSLKRIIAIFFVFVLSFSLFVGTVWADPESTDGDTGGTGGSACSADLSDEDCDAILNDYPNFVPDGDTSNTCSAVADYSGSSDDSGSYPQTAYAFFRSAGFDDLHAAAIYGNLYQESHMNPTIMQIGGNSNNPNDAGSGGWGIAQWTPGSKLLGDNGLAAQNGITGNIYDLNTQLALVLAEMKGTSPTGVQNSYEGLKAQTTLEGAVSYFTTSFEGPKVVGPRLQYAQDGLKKYGGQDYQVTETGGCVSASLSPDCKAASGSAKILCAAKVYDSTSYVWGAGHQGGSAWHDSCKAVGPKCGLDCSGLVNIAVYDAFKVDLRENTTSERSDSTNWQKVSFDQLQPGDIIQPGKYGGHHVEIVDHVNGSTIYTFGAHTSNTAQPEQVGPSQYARNSGDLYLHFAGSGS